MAAADFLEDNRALTIEDERRRVRRLMWSIPTKPVQICGLVIGISHQNHIRRKVGLLGKKLVGMLI